MEFECLFLQNLKAQVGINTNSPIGVFHVDGAKDNNVTLTINQQLNDVNITAVGNLGIGTSTPQNKVEIVSNTINTSGLKFSNLTSASTLSENDDILGLGVDSQGNVVATDRPFFASVSSVVINSSTAFLTNGTLPFFYLATKDNVPVKVPINANGSMLVDSFNLTIPTGGKGVMINFMIGIDSYGYQTNTCLDASNIAIACNNNPAIRDVFQARLYIDGVAQQVFQNVQMNKGTAGSSDSNLQFNFSTLINLSAGNHTLDVRISKVKDITPAPSGTIRFQTLSTSINATFIK